MMSTWTNYFFNGTENEDVSENGTWFELDSDFDFDTVC